MKKIYLLLLGLCLGAVAKGQNTANYSFATTVTGSLTDMSSGTTTLIAADQDDMSSQVTNIGFDFFFQGTRYAQFSVNSNGTLRLGAAAIINTLYDPLGQSGQALITAYGADQRTHAGDGKVHYKVTGAAPNRVLIVEWLNMQADFNSGAASAYTYQQRLSESTGTIEFVYGTMTMSSAGSADANSSSPQIGFSSGNTAGTIGSVTAAQSGTPAPSYNGAQTTPVNNAYAAGAVTVLSAPTDGSRRTFAFAPPAPTAAPTGLSFSGVAATSMTLNWTDNASNEVGYVLYNSTDGVNYTYVMQTAQNATSATVTGLNRSTGYSWKVYGVTEGALSSALSGTQSTITPGNAVTAGTGLWSSPATWSTGVVPGMNDSVTVRDGDVVTIDVAANAYTVVVGQGNTGVLQFEQTTARTLTVYTDLLINPGGTFQSATAGTQTGHTLLLNGSLTNNGTLDFSTNANTAGAAITFAGTGNASLSGSGTVTDIRQITVNKGTTNAAVVELRPSSFTVQGAVTDVAAGYLTLSNGTFKISGSFTYTGRTFGAAAYTIGATTGLWLNNPNYTIAAQSGNVVNNGLLRISGGAWNFGTANTATLTAGVGAAYLIEGGTMNVAGRMTSSNAITYTQTGGTVNIATVGNTGSGTTNASFGLTAALTVFSMSGGTINLVQPSTGATPIDWYVTTNNFTVTGGVLQVGTAATATNFNFRMRNNVPNLLVDNTTNPKTATFTAQTNTNGSVTINPGATIVSNGQIWLIVGSPVVNNGTITATGTNSRFYFLGNGTPQTYTGSGVANVIAFELENAAGVILDPLATGTINAGRVNFFAGGVTNANKLTIGTGGATATIIQMGVSGVSKTITGFDVAPTFNLGTGGQNLIYAPELTTRTTGPEIAPGRNLAALNVSNPNGIIIAGGDLAVGAGTTPTLTMASGNITTGSNTLTLGSSPTLPGTYSYTSGTIVGAFRRWISAATGNVDFPVGISTAKRNASVNFTTAPATGGTLTAQWVAHPGGSNGLPLTEGAINVTGTSSDGYWSVVAGDGLTGGVYTGTFTATGINNVTDVTTLVLMKRASSGSGNPWTLDGTHVTGGGTTSAPVISRTGMSGFSEFGIGSSAFAPLPVSLLTFSGQRAGSVNQLRWTTAGEQNNAGFEVQRSLNGSDYAVLGFVQARVSSGAGLSYDFTDVQPVGTVQYYRLRQLDRSGQGKYSQVIAIRGAQPAALAAALSPNPAGAVLRLLVAAPAGGYAPVEITDMSGRTVVRKMVFLQAGSSTSEMDIRALPAGSYFLKLTDGSGAVAVCRFTKE